MAQASKPSGGPWLLCLVGWDSSKTARGWLACGCPVLRIVLRFLLCSFQSLVHIRSSLFLFHKWEATKRFFFWRVAGGCHSFFDLYTLEKLLLKSVRGWTSLVVQWTRIHLPMQRTRVRSLVREDPTCRGEREPVHHNSAARALEPTLCNKRSRQNEKAANSNEDPAPQKTNFPF